MSHALVKQTKERQRQSFGFVKERIMNAQPCSVIEEVQHSGQCGGGLSLCGPQNSKVLLQLANDILIQKIILVLNFSCFLVFP